MTGGSRDNPLKRLSAKVHEVALPVCMAENFELIETECLPGKGDTVIRFYMDKPGGITIADCSYMSRQLEDLVDVYIEEVDSYRLEVSSPGPNRPLLKREDFEKFSESRIKIETKVFVQGKKKLTGTLKQVTRDGIVILADNRELAVDFEQIISARLAGE